jgi:hypothetical protein
MASRRAVYRGEGEEPLGCIWLLSDRLQAKGKNRKPLIRQSLNTIISQPGIINLLITAG